jgi:hypothetical protein
VGDKEDLTWKEIGPHHDLVVLWKIVPKQRRPALVRALQDAMRNWMLPPGFKTNRSFGKLPPGDFPYWQRREWNYFILWFIVVCAILAAAIRRNASYFF